MLAVVNGDAIGTSESDRKKTLKHRALDVFCWERLERKRGRSVRIHSAFRGSDPADLEVGRFRRSGESVDTLK